jgi:hypothetical protein
LKSPDLATASAQAATVQEGKDKECFMCRIWIAGFVTLIIAANTHARPAYDKDACAEVKQEIREIEARMRAGYTRAQGEKYEAKLRKLRRQRSKLCR